MEVSRASEISVLVRSASPSYEVLGFLDPAVNELLPAVDTHLRCVHAVPPSNVALYRIWKSAVLGIARCGPTSNRCGMTYMSYRAQSVRGGKANRVNSINS